MTQTREKQHKCCVWLTASSPWVAELTEPSTTRANLFPWALPLQSSWLSHLGSRRPVSRPGGGKCELNTSTSLIACQDLLSPFEEQQLFSKKSSHREMRENLESQNTHVWKESCPQTILIANLLCCLLYSGHRSDSSKSSLPLYDWHATRWWNAFSSRTNNWSFSGEFSLNSKPTV